MSHLSSKFYKSTFTSIRCDPYLPLSSMEVHLDLGLLLIAIYIIFGHVKTLPLSSFLPPSPNPTLNYLVLPYTHPGQKSSSLIMKRLFFTNAT
jgi:hypothetical protein